MLPIALGALRNGDDVLMSKQSNGVKVASGALPAIHKAGFANNFLGQGLMNKRVRLVKELVEFVKLSEIHILLLGVADGGN